MLPRAHCVTDFPSDDDHALDGLQAVVREGGVDAVQVWAKAVLGREAGCASSAVLTVHLARGQPFLDATTAAQSLVSIALRRGAAWRLGGGRGPVAHTFTPSRQNPFTQEH